ncbi:MAG: CpaF family protein [Candidatus Diapherotrites archaeon]|nr:CpaF family protein [Candidatus Diapherotrites archaeon]
MPTNYLKDLIEKAKKDSGKSTDDEWASQLKRQDFDIPTDDMLGSSSEVPREEVNKASQRTTTTKKKSNVLDEFASGSYNTEDTTQMKENLSKIKEHLRETIMQEKKEEAPPKGIFDEQDLDFSPAEIPPGEEDFEKKLISAGISKEKITEISKPDKKPTDSLSIPDVDTFSEELTSAEKDMAGAENIEVEAYGNVKIYRVPGQKHLYYFVPVPKPTESEKRTIRIIREAATRLITIEPYKIRDPEQRRAVYKQRIRDIIESSPEINIPKGKIDFYTDAIVREMVGYGLIDELLKDDRLEEIMAIGVKKPVYVFHRDYEMMKTNIEFFSESELIDLINKIAREVGRRVDFSNPLLDARLPDGSRVNATIPPASLSGPTLTIRKFREDPFTIVDLLNFKTVSYDLAAFLWLAVEGLSTRPANILIAGGTGSGKTTLLNVLASFVPPTERIISIEDTAELNLPMEHWIRFEARPPGLEGRGELTMDILTKNSLRMRPDRIIVGEIRHQEAFTLFTAMNTGHDGSMGTVHANSSQETIIRVTSPPMSVPQVMLSGLNFIIIEHRLHDKKKGTIRRVTELSEVSGILEGKPQTEALFQWDAAKDDIIRTEVPCEYLKELSRLSGITVQQIEKEISRRKNFLQLLVKKNIKGIKETSKSMQDFLESKDSGGR